MFNCTILHICAIFALELFRQPDIFALNLVGQLQAHRAAQEATQRKYGIPFTVLLAAALPACALAVLLTRRDEMHASCVRTLPRRYPPNPAPASASSSKL